jgi:hypothetical protein
MCLTAVAFDALADAALVFDKLQKDASTCKILTRDPPSNSTRLKVFEHWQLNSGLPIEILAEDVDTRLKSEPKQESNRFEFEAKRAPNCSAIVTTKEHGDMSTEVRVKLEAEACPPPAVCPPAPCDRPECENKCSWTKEYSREKYPCQYPAPSLGTQGGLGIGLAIAGGAGVALGIGFAVAAHDRQKDSDAKCGSGANYSDPNACTPEGLALGRAAGSYRTAANWTVGLGVVTAAVGGALLIPWRKLFGSSPQAGSDSLTVLPVVSGDAAGLSAHTTW